MGRGNDGKRFCLFAGQFGQNEENWEECFSVEALAGTVCPALPCLSPSSGVGGSWDPETPSSPWCFWSSSAILQKKEVRKQWEERDSGQGLEGPS